LAISKSAMPFNHFIECLLYGSSRDI